MNHQYQQEVRYRLLKILSEEPQLGQREMAKKMGISLGKVNYCISELAGKGWIKITRLKSARKKLPYIYMLTPKGLEEKGKLTVRFLKKKLSEYEEIKVQICEIYQDIKHEAVDNLDSELSSVVKSII